MKSQLINQLLENCLQRASWHNEEGMMNILKERTKHSRQLLCIYSGMVAILQLSKQFFFLSITYVALSEFCWKDQQAMAILVGCFSNDVFPVVQHLTENYKAQLIVKLATLTSRSFSDVQAYANHHLELCRRSVDLQY